MAPNTCSRSSNPQLGSLLVPFCYLQLLDLLTTLVFLANGVGEANPVVRMAMAAAGSRVLGLAALKAVAFAAAFYCAATGRARLLFRANLFFAGLVVWNLLAMLAR